MYAENCQLLSGCFSIISTPDSHLLYNNDLEAIKSHQMAKVTLAHRKETVVPTSVWNHNFHRFADESSSHFQSKELLDLLSETGSAEDKHNNRYD